MKIHNITSLAMLGLLSASMTAQAIDIGETIVETEVKMQNVDGSKISINDIKGEKGTLVIFTCNHCPFVIGWQKEMVAIGNEYQKKGIGVIFINSNDPSAKGDTFEGMQAMAKTEGYEFPYVVDATSDVAKKFNAAKTPDVFLFNAAGKLVYKGAVGEGARSPQTGGEKYLRNALDALISGQPVDNPVTKAIGCSIKFR
jgi:peroxiredoxin